MSHKKNKQCHKLIKKQSNIEKHETVDCWISNCNHQFRNSQTNTHPTKTLCLRQTNVFCSPIYGVSFDDTKKKLSCEKHQARLSNSLQHAYAGIQTSELNQGLSSQRFPVCKKPLLNFEYPTKDHKLIKKGLDQENLYQNVHHLRCDPFGSDSSSVVPTPIFSNPSNCTPFVNGTNIKTPYDHTKTAALLDNSNISDNCSVLKKSYSHTIANLPLDIPKLSLCELDVSSHVVDSDSHSPILRVRDLESSSFVDLEHKPHKLGSVLSFQELEENDILQNAVEPDLSQSHSAKSEKEILDFVNGNCSSPSQILQQLVSSEIKSGEVVSGSLPEFLYDSEDTTASDLPVIRVRDLESKSDTFSPVIDSPIQEKQFYGTLIGNKDNTLLPHESSSSDSIENGLFYPHSLKTDLPSCIPQLHSKTSESVDNKTVQSLCLQKTVHFDLPPLMANSNQTSQSSYGQAMMFKDDFLKEKKSLSHLNAKQSNAWDVVTMEDLYSDEESQKTEQNKIDNNRQKELPVSSTLLVASCGDSSRVTGNMEHTTFDDSASKRSFPNSMSNSSPYSSTSQETFSPSVSVGIASLNDVEFQARESKDAVISTDGYVDTTSEDEEDILHASINHLSFNSAHLVPLGMSLRLLRLRRILRGVDQRRKEDVMRKYRCFFKWRKNARLNQLLKQSYIEKWQRAEIHYQNKLLTRHFYSWSMCTKEASFLADSLHRKHMLTKGIKALKWFMMKCKERDAWLNRRRDFLTLKRMLMEWHHTFHIRREELLRRSFDLWKTQHRHSVWLDIVWEQRTRQKIIQCYCTWRRRFQQRELESVALSFYRTSLKRKVFQGWNLFVADCDVHRNQDQISSQYFEYKLLTQSLRRWTEITTRMSIARKQFNRKVLRQRFCEWRKSIDYLKLRHRKQWCAARHLRLRQLIKRSWNIWTSRLKAVCLYNKNRHEDLRTILNVWKFETAMKLHHQALSRDFQRKSLLQRTICQWKEFCALRQTKRFAAVIHLQRFVLRRVLTAWCEVVNGKRMVQEKLTSFRVVQSKAIQCRGFLVWKSLFYRILVERDARNQWSMTCVQRAASRWKDFVKKKNMERTCERMAVKVMKNKLHVCFNKWTRILKVEEEKASRAEALFGALSQRKRAKVIQDWHQLAQESYLIRPFVTTRERKHRTRVFDSWRGVVVKKRSLHDFTHKVKDAKTKAMFFQWRREFKKRTLVEETLKKKQDYQTFIVFQAWKEYTQRQRSFDVATHSRTDGVIRSCFCHWKARVLKRRLAEEEKLLRELQTQHILTKAFARWKREILCEKILSEDNVSWFTECRNLNLKTLTFKRWKVSLFHSRLAKQFTKKQLLATVSNCLKEWHAVTQNAIQAQSDDFCASLRTKSSTQYGDLSPVDLPLSSWIHCPSSLDSDLNFPPRLLHYDNGGSQISSPAPSRGFFGGDQATNSDSGLDLLKDVHSDSSTTSSRQKVAGFTSDGYHNHDCARMNSADSAVPYDVSTTCADLITPGVMPVHLVDCRALQVDHFPDHSMDTDGELTVRDLAGTEMDSSSVETCSSASEELITQRRVEESKNMRSLSDVRATSSNSVDWPAADEDFSTSLTEPYQVVAPPRPKHVFQVVAQECRLEKLVRFAATRLSLPSLSQAFYQWKLLSHASSWDKAMRRYSQLEVENRRLKQHFSHWRDETRRLHIWKKRCERALLSTCIQTWKDWVVRKQSLKRMKLKASSKNNQRLTSWCMRQWFEAHHRRTALEAILKYWKSRVPDRSQMTEKSLAMQTKHDSALLQRYVNTWKLRLNQLKACDVHHNKNLSQRALLHWWDYSRQRTAERQKIEAIRKKITMRRTLHTWSRALETHENIEQMRLRCLKSWLVSLIARWQFWAESESERCVRYHCLINLRRKEIMKQQFYLWRHKASLRLIADRSRDRAILYKCVISWRRIVVVNKIVTKQVNFLAMTRNRMVVTRCFDSWRSAYNMRLLEGEFNAYKQKKLWERWQCCFNTRRAERLGKSVTLRRFLYAWVNAHEESRKNLEISRMVVTKWHAMVLQHRQRQATTDAFTQRSSHALVTATFTKWSSLHQSLIRADGFYQRQKVKKTFLAWRSFVANEARTKRLATAFQCVKVERQLTSTWLRWRTATTRCVYLRRLLLQFQRIQRQNTQLQVWLPWKRSLDLAKARQFHQTRLKNKVFLYWYQAYENQQTAITFDLLRAKAVLREHVRSWHQLVALKKNILTQVGECKDARNRRITSSCYVEWRAAFQRLTVATNQSTMLMKRHALQRWDGFLKQRKIHQQNNERASAVNRTSLLKGCLRIWKDYHRAIQNNYFMADEVLCRRHFELQSKKWLQWKSALNLRQDSQCRTRLIERKVVDKWRQFVENKSRQRAVRSFQRRVAKRRSFNRWKENYKTRLFTRKRNDSAIKKCILAWQNKVSCALFARRYYDYKAVTNAWTAWRLRYASVNAANQSWDEMKRDLLMMTFRSWKAMTQTNRKLKEKSAVETQSRIPRLKRK